MSKNDKRYAKRMKALRKYFGHDIDPKHMQFYRLVMKARLSPIVLKEKV